MNSEEWEHRVAALWADDTIDDQQRIDRMKILAGTAPYPRDRRIRARLTALGDLELATQSCDLGLLHREAADLLTRLPALKDSRVAEFAPLRDLRRVDTL